MKHLLHTLVLFAVLACFACCKQSNEEEYLRNKSELMRIRKKSKQHKSLEEESGIDSLVMYFEKNGTEEDLFSARFYAAWYLLQNDQTQDAYVAFRDLCVNFPERHTETMSDMIRSAYSALQVICRKNGDFETADHWWQLSKASGAYTKPYWYILHHNKAWLMYETQKLDSCRYYMNRSFDELATEEWDENKSWCLNEQTAFFAMCGETYEFQRRHEMLKRHPYEGENGATNLNIGLLYMKQEKRDSAIYYFRKATSSTDGVALAALAQLAIDANNRGEKDSVFGYYQRSMERWNSMFQQKSESFTRRLETVYRNQELERQLSGQRIRMLALMLGLMTSLLLAVSGWWLTLWLHKKRMQEKRRLSRVKEDNERLEKQLQQLLEKMKANHGNVDDKQLNKKRIRLEHIAIELKQYAESKSSAPHQLCTELVQLFADTNSLGFQKLQERYSGIKPNDILLCILVNLKFGLSEIAYITNHDRQEIRQFILRISKGLTGEPIGRMADFKAMLDERFFVDAEE